MAKSKKEPKRPESSNCFYCEGSGGYWGAACGACDGTGEEIVRKQMQKVYNAKNKLALNYNLRPLMGE